MYKLVLKYVVLVASLLAANSPSSSVVRTGEGFIDYSNRVIVSRGTASISQNEDSRNGFKMIEKNLKISKGEAKAQARKNMIGLIKIVNFDGRTVGEIMYEDPLTQRRVETLVGSAYQQGEIEYLERQEVAIALAVKMSGLAEILVDAGGHLNENISQSTFLMTRNATPKSERISGVIIDARNIYHIPAMVPKIFNEENKLVYGPRHYTRSRSINRGPMGYAHNIDDGNVRRRVGENPIVIEALSSEDNTNLTISNLDSERVRDVEKRFGLLTNCKVLVLLK
tara:strand:+ start:6022 stop:6867 length:846 start_codon:yes stop_codon:yes gene_type:complete